MKPNMRDVVQNGYEADDYKQAFRAYPKLQPLEIDFLDLLTKSLPKGARVLDLGSGTGLPYD
jgi:hypothetical protein